MSVHSTEMFELIGVWAFHCVQFDDDLGLKSWSSGMHFRAHLCVESYHGIRDFPNCGFAVDFSFGTFLKIAPALESSTLLSKEIFPFLKAFGKFGLSAVSMVCTTLRVRTLRKVCLSLWTSLHDVCMVELRRVVMVQFLL